MNDWWKMSIQDRKYAKWYIDLKIGITKTDYQVEGEWDYMDLKDRMIHKIKTKEYDYPNTDYNKVIKNRYNYLTKTHPNKKCSFYYYKNYWDYTNLWNNCITSYINDYGKNNVMSKLYGKDYKSRTTQQNKEMFPGRVLLYHRKIKRFYKEINNNFALNNFYMRYPHKLYLSSYH